MCAFGLWILHSETRPAANLNDSAFHLQMVRWASTQIHQGRIPFDGWFPDLTLGSSFFHHYQSLAETLTAYTAVVDRRQRPDRVPLVPLPAPRALAASIYWSTRLLGWTRWTAAAAAAISPLLVSAGGYGYEHGSYTWQGYGVYSQEWAMWILPLAWGFTWRAVSQGKRYPAAAVALALTMATHFITGYVAMLTIGMWVIVVRRRLLPPGRPRGDRRRRGRARRRLGARAADRGHQVLDRERVLQRLVLQQLVRRAEGAGLALHAASSSTTSASR